MVCSSCKAPMLVIGTEQFKLIELKSRVSRLPASSMWGSDGKSQ